MKDHKHPTQPTELDERGVLRFRRNAISSVPSAAVKWWRALPEVSP